MTLERKCNKHKLLTIGAYNLSLRYSAVLLVIKTGRRK